MFLQNIFIRMTSSSDIMWNLFTRMIYYNVTLTGIHLYETCKKNLHKSSQYLQVLFHFPWVKVLGKRNHVIIFMHLAKHFGK